MSFIEERFNEEANYWAHKYNEHETNYSTYFDYP